MSIYWRREQDGVTIYTLEQYSRRHRVTVVTVNQLWCARRQDRVAKCIFFSLNFVIADCMFSRPDKVESTIKPKSSNMITDTTTKNIITQNPTSDTFTGGRHFFTWTALPSDLHVLTSEFLALKVVWALIGLLVCKVQIKTLGVILADITHTLNVSGRISTTGHFPIHFLASET